MGHVPPMGEKRNEYTVLVKKKIGREEDHLENLGVDGRLILT